MKFFTVTQTAHGSLLQAAAVVMRDRSRIVLGGIYMLRNCGMLVATVIVPTSLLSVEQELPGK